MDYIKVFHDFLLHEKRYSIKTADSYCLDIELMRRYFAEIDLSLEDAGKDDIKDYLGAIYSEVKASSLRRKIVAIRQFYLLLHKCPQNLFLRYKSHNILQDQAKVLEPNLVFREI